MFLTKNLLNACLKKKLFYKFTKSFEVKNIINKQMYYFCVLKKQRIYFVFYVLLLKLYYRNANIIASKNIIFVNKN